GASRDISRDEGREAFTEKSARTPVKTVEAETARMNDKRVAEKSSAEQSSQEEKQKKPLTKKQKMTIGIVSGVAAVLVIAIIITVIVVVNGTKKKFYEFHYEQGMKYYNEQNYQEALPYLKKAADTTSRRNNGDIHYDLYVCYRNLNQDDQALEV